MKQWIVSLAFAVSAILGTQAQASHWDMGGLTTYARLQAMANATAGLQWKVGDRADYKLDGGFIQGSVQSFVRQDTGSGFWVEQNMDLGFMGKQKVEILFDKATGQVLKVLANGQEQQLPDNKDLEVVEMKEDRIQVPAGTFDCVYVKIRDKKQNTNQEAWINPKAIPMSGLLKSISESQFGPIQNILTSFSFAN